MPSCERILLQHFHSQESRHYTENSVRQLMHSAQFRLYAEHMEYIRRLQLVWFIIPIGLTIAVYYHLLFLFQEPYEIHNGVPASNFPFFLTATTVLLFFLAPCVVIAPFTGFFEPLSRQQAVSYTILFTCINIAVTSFGGKWFHFPPYLLTDPRVPWLTGKTLDAKQIMSVTLTRVLPLQGSVVAGCLVYKWREMRWGTAWHVPVPLLSVPIFVGVFICLWFHTMNFLLSSLSLLKSSSFSIEGFDNDVAATNIFGILTSILSSIWQSMRDITTGRLLSLALTDAGRLYNVWCATLTLSVSYFIGVLISPLCVFLTGVFRLLPTHPTTWGLVFVLCIAAVHMLMRTDDGSIAYIFALLLVICALFYNGVVTTP